MGFRFRKSFSIIPGLKLNLSKGGVSLSAGVPGARVTFGRTGTTYSAGLPGTGLSYVHREGRSQKDTSRSAIGVDRARHLQTLEATRSTKVEAMYQGKQIGPLDLFTILAMIRQGRAPRNIPVRKAGTEKWEEVPMELIEMFNFYASEPRLSMWGKLLWFLLIGVAVYVGWVIITMQAHH